MCVIDPKKKKFIYIYIYIKEAYNWSNQYKLDRKHLQLKPTIETAYK